VTNARSDDFQATVDNGSTVTSATTLVQYTVPATAAGGKLKSVALFHNAGAPTVQLQIIRGAATIVVENSVAGVKEYNIPLLAGDVVRLQTTVGAVGGSADAVISGEYYT
jgi:hypothetical protein